MTTATLERLPNTVTKCHALIGSLQEAVGAGSAERIAELEAENEELKAELKEAEERIEKLEENENPDAVLAIEKFLDECERTGPLRFDVPQSERVNHAIVGLHDAAGRQP